MSLELLLNELGPDLLMTLAINLGLLILLLWFVILWLMLREFRQALGSSAKGGALSQSAQALCEESVNHALNYSNENRETLNALVQIQQALEQQVAEIRAASSGHSREEQASIELLNQKLSKSHQLIRKLKGDLDKSTRGLRKAKSILLEQNDTVAGLRQQKEAIEKQFEQLEREYIMISESGGFQDIEQNFAKEKEQLLATIENYKRQLANQMASAPQASELNELKQQLATSQKQLLHLGREKAFIEKKYLELSASQSSDAN
ncbi:GumC domain-containing protein [Vibrio navarrensis]|uniref:chromosome partitioning protein ParA n=1 Tax=Vibrio navarrensis TaxID=29495 RepID=UPI00186A80E0|nr:chromosome partitioning protein ParA [Vibrio navarrensis]MBE4620901.1 chromosome partitioning protein ParA [Vibrio navarrensis]